MFRQEIISKLIQARLEAGISQQELAKRIGTKKPNISRIESGQQNLSLDMMSKIANALNKDVSVNFTEKITNHYSLRLYDTETMSM